MNKKTSRMLHISSESQQQTPSLQKSPSPVNKDKNTLLKYNTFKSQSFQLQKNTILGTAIEEDYIFSHPQQRKETQTIKFVQEQYFNITDHTIQERVPSVQEGASQKTDISLLAQLNKMKLEQKGCKNVNPELEQLRKPNRKNKILQANFSSDSENQNFDNIPKIAAQVEENEKISNNQDERGSIKEVEWDYKTTKEEFAIRKIKQNQRLHLVLQRQKSGVNFFLPEFNLLYRNDVRYILSCKKILSTNFQCLISFSHVRYEETSPQYVGRIAGNFKNTIFNLHQSKKKGISCTTKFRKQDNTGIVAPFCYDIYLLNEGCRYEDLIGCDGVNFQIGLDQMYLVPHNRQYLTHFRNKKPEYSEKLQAYMLNFGGRVNQGSIKNFIVEDSKSGREILMFGKGLGESFNLYISAPLNPLLALAIVIPNFASRIMLK